MKKTTKRNINILAISLLSIGTAFTIGLTTGKYINGLKDNYIKFELDDESVTLNSNEISTIESIVWNKNNKDNNSLKLTREETGKTTSQITADVITTMFMEYSLTGSTTFDVSKPFEQLNGYILSPDSSESWIAPHINNYEDLYEISSYIEVFNNTTGASTFVDFWVFATNILEASSDLTLNELAANFVDPELFKTFFDAKNDSLFSDLVDELGSKLSYKLKLNNFLYIYSYLWQESSRENYDYFLTEEMIKIRPSLIWSVNFQDPEESFATEQAAEDAFSSIDALTSSQSRADAWNQIVDNVTAENIKSNKFASLTETGVRGFDGMVSKNSSSLIVDSNFWDYNQIWDFDTYYEDGKIILNSDYSKEYPNMYQNELGKYLNFQESTSTTDPENPDETETIPSSYYVYQNFLFYPFAFPEDYNIETELAKSWNYSLVAYENPTGEIQFSDDGTSGLTEINYFDYMFDSIDINSDGVKDQKDVEIIELYLVSSLINLDVTNIKTNAYSYWKSEGFYIELSGDYKDKYGELIPAGIQK